MLKRGTKAIVASAAAARHLSRTPIALMMRDVRLRSVGARRSCHFSIQDADGIIQPALRYRLERLETLSNFTVLLFPFDRCTMVIVQISRRCGASTTSTLWHSSTRAGSNHESSMAATMTATRALARARLDESSSSSIHWSTQWFSIYVRLLFCGKQQGLGFLTLTHCCRMMTMLWTSSGALSAPSAC